MAGVDLTTVSRLLDHRDLTITLHYAHLSLQHATKAIVTLDRVYNEVDIIAPVVNYTKIAQSVDFGGGSLASA